MDPAFPAIIIDDICDGGGTFVGIADKVGRAPLGMYITHGIFSQGFDALRERFEHIYTTNSLKKSESAPAGLVTVFDCLPEMMKERE